MPLIDLELDDRFQQSYELKMTYPVNDPGPIPVIEEIVDVNGERFYVTEVIDARDNNAGVTEVFAESAWMKLADLKRPGTFKIEAETPLAGLNMILYASGWSVSVGTTDATEYSDEFTDSNLLEMIWQWAKLTGNEVAFQPMSKEIQFLPTIGVTRPYAFRYGRNMQSIKRTVTAPRATRLYAYGKREADKITTLAGGKEYIEDYSYYTGLGMSLAEAQENYRKEEIFVDDTITDPAALYLVAQRRLAILAQPSVQYEAKVIDLTTLIGLPEADYQVGDSVYIYDDLLNISQMARVTRTVKYPHSPHKNQVELTFGGILLDTGAMSSRDHGRFWELYESHNRNTERRLSGGSGTHILNRLGISVGTGAKWVVGYSLHAVGVGTGTLVIEFTNDDDAQAIWPTKTFDFVDGQEINLAWTYGEDELPASDPIMVVRAEVTGGSVTVPERGTALWVMAQGATQTTPTLADSIRFDFNGDGNRDNGSVQTFTVPDDVTEIQVEAYGGSGNGLYGGKGGKVVAKFSVAGGTIYDIYVGGGGAPSVPSAISGAWPNGGQGGNVNTPGHGGGGASWMVATGGSIASAIIVAGGGGGQGASDAGNPILDGGHAGYYAGMAGESGGIWGQEGQGATQTAGGAGGTNLFFGFPTGPLGEDGDTDGQGQGGDAGWNPGIATAGTGAGGGGGGFHGGGGGGYQGGPGGGGSGWSAGGWDLEFANAENVGHGYILISWEEPEEVT